MDAKHHANSESDIQVHINVLTHFSARSGIPACDRTRRSPVVRNVGIWGNETPSTLSTGDQRPEKEHILRAAETKFPPVHM